MSISKIHLEQIATYTQEGGIDVEELAPVNFFYGVNGSGKTTISKILADKSRFPHCEYLGGNDHSIHVYNEEFRQNEVFESDIKGVFSLGKESKEIEDQIKQKTAELESTKSSIEGFKKTTFEKQNEEGVLLDFFKERCWEIKTELESNKDLKDAFQGVRNDKSQFSKKVLTEAGSNTFDLLEYDAITKKAQRLFGIKPVKVTIPDLYDFNQLETLNDALILKEVIKGKEDVEINAKISELNNSDWVKAGIIHLEKCSEVCPFCQSEIDVEGLKMKLKEYYDKAYTNKINDLELLKSKLQNEKEGLEKHTRMILESGNSLLDSDKLQTTSKIIGNTIEKNIVRIQIKIENSSQITELKPYTTEIMAYTTLIEGNISESKDHNNSVDNFAVEHTQLKGEVWKYVVEKLSKSITDYKTTGAKIKSAIIGIQEGITKGKTKVTLIEKEISNLESQINSLKPTISEINKTLKDFGFHSFSIQEKNDRPGYYSIVRADSSSAKDTLSEGEKTFIAFLYYYYRINGVLQGENVTSKKILVIDDPISSLDSNIVFVVASMIKKLIKEVANTHSSIEQIFVMTHNIYFHKEVSYESKGMPTANRKYWLIRKKAGVSEIEYCSKNPVTSTYQMMWKEIHDAKPLTICNILRRILETYFQHYGDSQLDQLPELFEGDEQIICRSLISWIHDGSHSIMDDLYVSLGDDTVDKYKVVFKKIFEQKGQIAHYNMMIRQS